MEGYKELLNQLNGIVNSLEKGELSLEELNELESVTRTLHERSIILRYKAFETSVLGGESDASEGTEATEEMVPESVIDEQVSPEPAEAVEIEEESSEEQAFDFAIFDEETTEEASTEEAEESIPEPVAEIEPTSSESTELAHEEDDQDSEAELETTEEVQPEPIPDPDPEPQPSAAASSSSFLDRFSLQDNSLAGRFSAGPLDSLIGAFGLNERLRFINDLFDGSSEKFSDAIKALDTQPNLDDARTKVAGYAEENEWDPEEEVVAEFMNYLNRRYA